MATARLVLGPDGRELPTSAFQVVHAYFCPRVVEGWVRWQPGETVQLTDDQADFIARDSPGAITPLEET